MKKILIIEDDLGISSSLKMYLENSDFKVILYHTGEKAVEKILEEKPDLVILDINLPSKDGIEICRELRVVSDIIVIMLTAKGSELDRVTGLETWADDYIAKPFSPRILLARIHSLLRRLGDEKEEKEDGEVLRHENIEILLDKMIVNVDNQEVSLTKNEYDILKRIMQEKWKIVSRETIMTEVIGYEKYIYDRTIDTHIKNLRKKLWDKEIIITVRGEWYRLR